MFSIPLLIRASEFTELFGAIRNDYRHQFGITIAIARNPHT